MEMSTRLRSVPRHGGFGIVLAAAIAVALAIPAVTQAAVTIGEDTSTTGAGNSGCSNIAGDTCTWFQPAHPTRSYAAPFDGVIVRWRIRGDSDHLQYSLRVLHMNDGTFTGAGTSEPRTVLQVVENIFDTRLPIKQGELIGVDVPGDPSIPTIESSTVPGSQAAGWDPRLADGETRVTDFAHNDRAHLYNADIEPDCDQDGFGDESQDPVADCDPPETTITGGPKNVVKTRKRRAKVSFTFASSEPGTFECSLDGAPFTPCSSPSTHKVKAGRRKPKQHTFQVRAIDAAGNPDPAPAADELKATRKKRRK